MGVTINAQIVGFGSGEPGLIEPIVNYQLSQGVNAAFSGQKGFLVDNTLTDQEIESSVRAQLAAYITELSGVSFVDSDVRGCHL